MLVQFLLTGLALGSIYGLVALGFAVIYKAERVFNFAQGILMVCGAYLAYTATTQLGLPFPVAVIVIIAAAALLGIVIQFLFIRPLSGQPLLPVIMITIALSIILKALIEILYGVQPKPLATSLPTGVLILGDVRLSQLNLTAAVVSWVCMGVFFAFFRFTKAGLLMRATADSHEAAILSGVNVNRINAGAWAIGTILAVIGGVFLGQIQLASTELEHIGLLALPAVVIGGLQSIPGAIVGGILVGVIEQLASGYISPKARDVFIYIPLLIMLLVRPWGLFGNRELGRV
ncbi:branched-chain amino acid ABC transporter permease [Propylenella binzhouense]|uniref:Branched-chain amino acid ABC transporter permease n=1 Tax=Propylenella binzhouense TaxID=2555902 RepID=A0A964WSI5_9HYPH|nr:branched-chain amino acid ABC transporter permease [Propylenella binzhouense]MYZ46911.1 branched-chain amino acid ABC transporter permease [Propylenella binzhouense]